MEILPHSSLFEASLSTRNALCSAFVMLVAYFVYNLILDDKSIPGFEVAGKRPGEWTNMRARYRFILNAKDVVETGLKQAKNGIFQVITHSGPQVVLPVRFLDEIRNNPHLDLHGMPKDDWFSEYAAFSPIRVMERGHVMVNMINRKLTTSLALVTAPVNEETNIAMERVWPRTDEWRPSLFVNESLELVAQVSSRIFVGAPLCRNPEWIRLAKNFTVDFVTAAYAMRFIPTPFRPLFYYILPPVYKLKNTVKAAHVILKPEVEERRRVRNEALARGEATPKRLDSFEWIDDVARSDGQENFDAVGAQLVLSFVAMHTTSMATTNVLYDIIEHSELIPELRQEIITVMKEDQGWQKTSLYKLKLLDSVMKESQRMSLGGTINISRHAQQDITLSDGTTIPKDARLGVPMLHMHDPEFYPNPETFDGKRFLRLRELPENTNKYQFVTTSMDHLGFGHGKHACPGRFFASNEIKIMICHLLMKYDWRFKDNKRPANVRIFNETILDPKAEIQYKSRVSEVAF
ncbi:hypothetical protein FKW77_000811 [Venturia effusa]|uniref:Cytochrome P450 monooxygenase n=1 Tax=Venturia effusa TaxID=50376 RepID=A0A517LGF9_9PEZI|nr:hypothetical protein FKW77_000811 [Venturia effusa]